MKIGAQAELVAANYLCQRGLRLLVQNYHCRYGEIDLILQDGETLVFAEVRLRSSQDYGGAAASIDARKQRKLICTAQHYLTSLTHIPPCRFDAVLLTSTTKPARVAPAPAKSAGQVLPLEFPNTDIEWIKNAFSA